MANISCLKSNSELRQKARENLSGKWVQALLAGLVAVLPTLVLDLSVPFLNLFIAGPLAAGSALYFTLLAREKNPAIEVVFSGFKNFIANFVLNLLISIYTFLWMLLLIIPGIVKAHSYSMSYYIKNDNPDLSANDAIDASRQMMQGHKMKLFLLMLSFTGWFILSLLTCGLGFIFLTPYVNTTLANFYCNLKECQADSQT